MWKVTIAATTILFAIQSSANTGDVSVSSEGSNSLNNNSGSINVNQSETSSNMPTKVPYLSRAVVMPIYARLKNEDMVVDVVEAAFMRYSTKGRVEAFSCGQAAAFKLYPYHSDSDSMINVGDCSKDSVLNLQYAATQLKAFSSAAGPMTENWKKQAPQLFKPSFKKGGAFAVIYLPQLFISGVGEITGHEVAASETVLLVPNIGNRVIFVQGVRPNCSGGPNFTLEACENFPKLLQDIAELVFSLQLGIGSAP